MEYYQMSTEVMTTEAMYWLADCTGITLHATKAKVTGTGKLKIPLVNKQRLVFNLAVVASKWFKKYRVASLVVHVRWDMYMYIEINLTTKQALMMMLDSTKIEPKMVDVFKSAQASQTVLDRLEKGIVGVWRWDAKSKGAVKRWIKEEPHADSVGE
jgi:hypothetical protein